MIKISLIILLFLIISIAESKTFINLEPREIETDCGKFSVSASKAPKCCPTTCRKCNKGLDKRKKSVCHWLKVGKNGRREKCCTFFTICRVNKKKVTTCYNTKRVCRWTSKLVKTYKKTSCVWQANGGGKQRKCCRWTVKCFGKKCFELRKKCQWKGKIVTKSKEHGCRWQVVGKNTRRRKCCKQLRKCVGKKCSVKDTKCKWVSLPIKFDWVTKCKWHRKGSVKIKRCCRFFQRCIGKKCTLRKNSCKISDKTTIKRTKECYWRKYKKGRRQRCCAFSTYCRKKLCRKLFRKCKWIGRTIWWTSTQKCGWKLKSKNTRQKRCCKFIKKCIGKKCKTVKTLCDWRGHPIYSKLRNNCKWVAHHKEGSRQFCCKSNRICKGKSCKVLNKKCGFTGKTVQWKTITNCKWAKFKDYKQRRCCYRRIRCVNKKNCRVFKESCRYLGSKVTKIFKKTCKVKREKNGKRKTCCTFFRYCYGKRCKDINRKCKVGKVISYVKTARCFFEKVVLGWRRKVCCASAKKCYDNKCKRIRRMCKVTAIRKRTKYGRMKIILIKRKYENEKKERIIKVKKACNCFKQESQNLKVYQSKRNSISKKFQKCKSKETKLKTSISKNKKSKLYQRGLKCKKLFNKLNTYTLKITNYKKFVGKTKVECINERTNYKNYLKKIRFEQKKLRVYERKQERIERAVLIKKYENKELRFKLKIEARQINLNKDIKKLSTDCKKTLEQLKKVKNIASSVDKRFLKVENNCKNKKKLFEVQKESLKKREMESNKKPKDNKLRNFVLAQKMLTQQSEQRYLSCNKRLEKLRILKRNSDNNFKNAEKNNNNCSSQLRKEKNITKRVEKRETTTRVDLKKLLQPKPKPKINPPKPKPRPVIRRPIVRRRRGRGDVWLQDKKGNWVDVNVEGTFIYMRDPKNGIEIDTQFGQKGLGSVISAIILKARNNVIKAERNGQVTINGRLVQEKSAFLIFNGNNVQVKKIQTKKIGLFIVKGLREDKLSFRYFKKVRSYDLNAASSDNNVIGLFRDPANPRKYILPKKLSNFAKYLRFDLLDETDGNPEQKVAAEKCCDKLKNIVAKDNCKKDYYRTDVCFLEEYTDNNFN